MDSRKTPGFFEQMQIPHPLGLVSTIPTFETSEISQTQLLAYQKYSTNRLLGLIGKLEFRELCNICKIRHLPRCYR